MVQLRTWSEYFAPMTTKDLKKNVIQLDRLVNVTECFNTHDLVLLMKTQQELERRKNGTRKLQRTD